MSIRTPIPTYEPESVGSLRPLFGGQERGMAGVPDGGGQGADRGVGQGLVVELVRPDVLIVEDAPRPAR